MTRDFQVMLGKQKVVPVVQGPRERDGCAPAIGAGVDLSAEVEKTFRLQMMDGYNLPSEHASDGGARRKGKIR
jgi:hypothetical protein